MGVRARAVLGVGVLLATAGCGARWSDDQEAAVLARHTGAAPAAATRAAAAEVAAPEQAPASGPHAAPVDAGAARPVGAAAAAGADGAAPCAAPSTAPGVTTDTITVANISTLSGPVAGLGTSAQAATRAYAAHRNATGGVCGRKVEVRTGDDGMDGGRFRSMATELEPRVLGFVGGMAGGDGGGVELFTAKHIPAVGVALSEGFTGVPSVFDVNPPFGDTSRSSGKYRFLHGQGVRKAAIVYLAVDSVQNQVTKTERPLLEAAGIEVVHQQALPLTTLSYDSAARAVANSGADYLLFIGGYDQNSNMARSMEQTGHELRFEDYLAAYGTNFIELAGSAGEGAISWSFAIPTEEAGSHPEGATYLRSMRRTAPGVHLDTFSAQAWVAAKAFFDSLEALPGPITRDALVAKLRTLTDYDAGGFYGRFDLANEVYRGCQVGVRVVDGAWKRFTPAQGFLC